MYYFIWCINSFFSFFDMINYDEKKKKYIYMVSFIILLVFGGLRYKTGGPDWISYERFFQDIEPINEVLLGKGFFFRDHGFEIGFKIYASILKFISDNFQILIFVTIFINLVLIYNSFKKYCKYYIVAISIYFSANFLLNDMTIVRQSIAIALFVYSVRFIGVNFKKYLLYNLFMILFHSSAIILFPLYFVLDKKITKKVLIISFIIGNIIILTRTSWATPIIDYFMKHLLSEHIYTLKAKEYIQQNNFRELGVGYIERTCGFILGILFRKKIIDKYGEKGNVIMNIFFMNILFNLYFSELAVFVVRIRAYFSIINAIVYTYFWEVFGRKQTKLIVLLTLMLYNFTYIWMIVSQNSLLYEPYQNYFMHKITGNEVPRERMIEEHFMPK